MAKGQQRSNKETKKPKKAATAKPSAGTAYAQEKPKSKKGR